MKILKTALGIIIFFAFISISAAAYVPEDADVSPILEAIPSELREFIPDNTLSEGDAVEIAEGTSLENIGSFVFNLLQKLLPKTLEKLCSLLGFTVILSLINTAKDTLSSQGFVKIISFSTSMAASVFVYDLLSDLHSTTELYLESVGGVINAFIPIMTLLYTIGGNVSAAAVNASGTAFMLTFINVLFKNAIIPLIDICFILSICGLIGNVNGISHLTKKIKGVFSFICTATMTILSFFLLFKTNIASAADSVTARTIKFAGSFIPVIGSALGDSVRTVMSGLSLIKTSAGFVGIIVIFIITVPAILSSFMNKLCIDITCGLAKMLNCQKESEIFSEYSSLLGFTAAIQIGTAILFIIELTIFVNIAPALGGG